MAASKVAALNTDVERASGGADDYSYTFDDDTVRMGFIRKVYGLLAVQLSITFGIVCIFVHSDRLHEFVDENPYLFILALAIVFVTSLLLACCTYLRRTPPCNFICLLVFTLAESFLLGVITTRYDPSLILIALGLTVLITVTISLFAFQTNIDFTVCGGFLLIALVILLVFGIVTFFFPSQMMRTIYASAAVLLFSFYLLYDTQLMMTGKHMNTLTPDEYIFACLNLYIDIIQIFIYILMLLGMDD